MKCSPPKWKVSMTEPVVRSVVSIPKEDGSTEWWELTDQWRLIRTEAGSHSHATLGDINFTGTVSADGNAGLTGQKTIAGYTFTFKKGLLVGFQAP